MIKFYVNMIRNGRMAIEDVPAKWRDEVGKVLEGH